MRDICSAQDDVERAGAAVAGMSAAYGSDVTGVTRGGQPVPDCCPNGAPLAWPSLAAGRVAGDQQENARARCHRLLQLFIEEIVGGGEGAAVEIDGQIGLDLTARQTAVPAAVEGGARHR